MSAATATNLKLKEDISQRCYEVKNEIKRLGIERTNGGIRNEGKTYQDFIPEPRPDRCARLMESGWDVIRLWAKHDK